MRRCHLKSYRTFLKWIWKTINVSGRLTGLIANSRIKAFQNSFFFLNLWLHKGETFDWFGFKVRPSFLNTINSSLEFCYWIETLFNFTILFRDNWNENYKLSSIFELQTIQDFQSERFGYIDVGDKWMLVTLSWWQFLDVSDRISILVTYFGYFARR